MSIIEKSVIDYINETQHYFDGILGEIQKDSLEKKIPIIPPETARFLATLLSIKKPCNVLEIGCAVGFSAGLISRYLDKNGHITTIDRFDIMIRQAKENFKKLEIEDKVSLIEGDACEILPTLNDKEYDFIFLDAAKGQYLQILPHCIRLLKVGGLFLADNVIQDGRVAMDRFSVPKRQRTIHTRMRKFLFAVSNTIGLESSIIPIGDGLLLSHKTQEIKEIIYE